MDLMPISQLTKFAITMDDTLVGEFYHTSDLSFPERRQLADEYASYHFISSRGIKVYSVTNNGKLGGVKVMAHHGKVS